MEASILIIWIWAALSAVMVLYVVFRLFRDRRTNSKRHPFYPFVSNPNDGMFPQRSEKKVWGAYLFLVVGFIAFLGNLATEVFGTVTVNWLAPIAMSCILIGILLLILRFLKRCQK